MGTICREDDMVGRFRAWDDRVDKMYYSKDYVNLAEFFSYHEEWCDIEQWIGVDEGIDIWEDLIHEADNTN